METDATLAGPRRERVDSPSHPTKIQEPPDEDSKVPLELEGVPSNVDAELDGIRVLKDRKDRGRDPIAQRRRSDLDEKDKGRTRELDESCLGLKVLASGDGPVFVYT